MGTASVAAVAWPGRGVARPWRGVAVAWPGRGVAVAWPGRGVPTVYNSPFAARNRRQTCVAYPKIVELGHAA